METAKDILRKILEEIFQKYDFDFEIKEGDEAGYFTIRIKSKVTSATSNEFRIAMIGNGICFIHLYSKSAEAYEEIGSYHLVEESLKLNDDFWEKMFMYHLFD